MALLLVAAVTAPAPLAFATSPSVPNIVFILADDLGYGDLGCYGAKDIRTPRLDRLAVEGLRFTQCYANGPECSPTRAALLTGRYQQRIGGLECAIGIGGVGRYDDAIRLAERHELGLPASESTLGQWLQAQGYATALIGKWHLGYEPHFTPARHGFEHALYCLGGGMEYFHHVEDPPGYAPVLRLNGEPITRPGYATDLFADEAVGWLRKHHASGAKKPFFLYLPFTAPHSPYQAPDEEQPVPLPADSVRWKQAKGPPQVYRAMVERLDAASGRVLDTLEQLGLARNTVVVFSSDNGGTASARPSGLRGIKGTTFEGGIRVPCLVRWPGVLPSGAKVDAPAATFDLTASLARAAGVKPPRVLDGIDILDLVARGQSPPARTLFWRARRGTHTWRAAREGTLKYVVRANGPRVEEFLFDLAHDPAEATNLLAARPSDAGRIRRELGAWETRVRAFR